jgi:hypothetical protein
VAWRALNTFFKVGVATFSILVVLGIIAAVLHGIWDQRTRIEAISVPKSFADSGYTPEVASQRLRDALLDYTKKANSSMHSPAIALHGELKDIIVPKIDLSLDSLISTVRNFFGKKQPSHQSRRGSARSRTARTSRRRIRHGAAARSGDRRIPAGQRDRNIHPRAIQGRGVEPFAQRPSAAG